jgi:hypothetical protein
VYKALLAACAAALLVVPTANASKHMLVGINDEADTLYGNPDVTFPILRRLHVQVLRVNLYWGRALRRRDRAAAQSDEPARPGL